MTTILGLSAAANIILLGMLIACVRSYRHKAHVAHERRLLAESWADQCGQLRIELAEAKQALSEERPADSHPSTEAYAVTGAARPLPWHLRRKELEAQHRRKRQQLEEFRESA